MLFEQAHKFGAMAIRNLFRFGLTAGAVLIAICLVAPSRALAEAKQILDTVVAGAIDCPCCNKQHSADSAGHYLRKRSGPASPVMHMMYLAPMARSGFNPDQTWRKVTQADAIK